MATAILAWSLFSGTLEGPFLAGSGDSVAEGSPAEAAADSSAGAKKSRATVEHVVDGDTVYLIIGGKRTKVRLLNVDAPEIPYRGEGGECFGEEATRFLEKKLPQGSKVDVEYDLDRFDQYGRTLAGITYKGEFINEALVASGYATAMKVQPNTKFYESLRAAQGRAERANAGMFDPVRGCL